MQDCSENIWKNGAIRLDAQRILSRWQKEFKEYAPHLVLMDIGLPFYNGFYWCTEIRKTSNVPILFLSSMSDNMNIVMAIQMGGGTDFVTKAV